MMLILALSQVAALRRKKNTKKSFVHPLMSSIMGNPRLVDPSKRASFTALAHSVDALCKSKCTFHVRSLSCLRADSFICECKFNYYHSKDGNGWEQTATKAQYQQMAESGDCYVLNI